ncbi:hypothetical protein G9A89_018796 [Geosiphon pyriformis]|nr:hypothetical protein G9A89_018796 [Geosiphon pyriformis]
MANSSKPSLQALRQLVPPLSPDLHKGQAGRIGIIGGSEEYTGAPYFSAIAALKTGADMGYVVCVPEAAVAIKSYSPDLMVVPHMLNSGKNPTQTPQEIAQKVAEIFSRLHVLVVGPGLSRDQTMQESAKWILLKAKEQGLPVVIDADGLFLVQNHSEIVKNYKKAILTPNIKEFQRLCESMKIRHEEYNKDDIVKELSKAYGGVTIVRKGQYDLISNGETIYKCDSPGGLKRCGGQGDILTGVIATFLAWGTAYQKNLWQHDQTVSGSDVPILASYAGCLTVRDCARNAGLKFGRSVQTSDMIPEIGPVFHTLFESSKF